MAAWEHPVDAAVARLEDVLLAYPYDRALPALADILAAAQVTEDLLQADERALKVLHEAVVARPLAELDHVAALRSEVELLTVEARVLTDRLQAGGDDTEVARVRSRLARIHRRLDEVRRDL